VDRFVLGSRERCPAASLTAFPDTEDPSMTQPAILGDMARGSAVMILMRWSIRLIGVVSTMILARLLTPQDFGVVAIATVFVGFIELFSFLSFDLALIRIPEPDREDYDTAWTLQVILGAVLSLTIVAAAPFAASYFSEPRLLAVVRLLAVNSLLQGLSNIGLADFRKNLDFQKDLRFNVYSRLIVFAATMLVAFFIRNYWALVTGLIAGNTVRLVLSYLMHPFRPRFGLKRSRQILSFSSWMLLFHVGTYFRNRLDTLLVARLTGASSVGVYNVASELSAMPTNELVVPTGRALFPAYAHLAREPESLRAAFRTVLGFFFTVVLPICAGMNAVAPHLVRVVLGDKWMAAAPLVSLLTFAGGFNAIAHVIGTFHAADGRERFSATLNWMNVAALVPALAIGANWGVPGIAGSRVVVSCLVLAIAVYSVVRTTVMTGKDFLEVFWRPALSAAVMAALLWGMRLELRSPLAALLVNSSIGLLSFVAVSYSLWWLSARPPGVESIALDFFKKRLTGERRPLRGLTVRGD
jgi:O-antigen/teichoic acid export membrane protein